MTKYRPTAASWKLPHFDLWQNDLDL